MINPHNPEFITRRPWYLGGNDAGPSLDHQGDQRTEADRLELSMTSADRLVQMEREKLKKQGKSIKWKKGMWIEALKHNKLPYMICQITKYDKKNHLFDLKYEDGSVEKKVKFNAKKSNSLFKSKHPRIRMTKTGSRSFAIDHTKYGKETYDSKRDKYHGYDATTDQHMSMIEEKYSRRDTVRRRKRELKQEQLEKERNQSNGSNKQNLTNKSKSAYSDSDSDTDYDSDSGSESDDEFVQRDEDTKTFTSRLARQGGVGGAQMKVTARNLRIREDTAKYLRNLDLNSAYYDPKSRSMRDNPNPDVNPEELQFAGDNFARVNGDAVNLAKTQVFAWDGCGAGSEAAVDAAIDGNDGAIHPQANPSQVELLKKSFDSNAEEIKKSRKKTVLEKYGGAEYLDGGDGVGGKSLTPSGDNTSNTKTSGETVQERMVRFGASVANHEYTRDGRIIQSGNGSKNIQNVRVKQISKYEEDIFINGHTTVWGSYFHPGAFRWGYADDHSLMKNSYCTGETGRKANDDANELRYGTGELGSASLAQAREMLKATPKIEREKKMDGNISKSKLYGEVDQHAVFDKSKVKEALKREKDKDKAYVGDDRKRKFNSMEANNDVTEEEMEAYRIKKERSDDPMTKIKSDELLEYK